MLQKKSLVVLNMDPDLLIFLIVLIVLCINNKHRLWITVLMIISTIIYAMSLLFNYYVSLNMSNHILVYINEIISTVAMWYILVVVIIFCILEVKHWINKHFKV